MSGGVALVSSISPVAVADSAAAAQVEPGSVEFTFTGAAQTWTVPNGVTAARIEVRGAQGGNEHYGGLGGSVVGSLTVTPGEVLTVVVGGQGSLGSGGFNGGATGGAYAGGSYGGGGASDIRRGGTLADRVVVAAGGGGAGTGAGTTGGMGGSGGGLSGGDGGSGACSTVGGGGASQTSGGAANGGTSGALGVGGAGGSGLSGDGGGGGGGYFGGGGGRGCDGRGSGGGGGSSWTHPSVVADVQIAGGVNRGTGKVVISWPVAEEAPPAAPVPGSATFEFTGGSQWFTVPDGVTALAVDVYGGQGGSPATGGPGGRVRATIPVVPGDELQVNVGGQGGAGVGGFNGGAAGGAYAGGSYGGGGASDVRRNGVTLTDRVVVAGGGGGAGTGAGPLTGSGGFGGAQIGGSGGAGCNPVGGGGGTQTAGGSGDYASPGTVAVGGRGGNGLSGDGGGGGGGFYGGGGGRGCQGPGNGGGGGSNWVAPGSALIKSERGIRLGHGRVVVSWPPAPVPPPSPAPAGSQTFTYIGAPEWFTVPEGVNAISVTLRGAQGEGLFGGRGGELQGVLAVAPGSVLQVNVGGQNGHGGGATGGSYAGGSTRGGGASDIRMAGASLDDRVAVAAGGGGAGTYANATAGWGGPGGGVVGLTGGPGCNATGGGGGTQTAGGSADNASPGQFGAGGKGGSGLANDGGGGGGGWYGGGGGRGCQRGIGNGGGGGSSYAHPTTAVEAYTEAGLNEGHGSVVISWPVVLPVDRSFGRDSYGELVHGVHVGSGNFVEQVTDVDVATAGPDLSVRRTYNSLDAVAGLFGRGWSTLFDARASVDLNGAVSVVYPDGRRETHTPNGGGTYRSPTGYVSRLVDRPGGVGGWTLHHKDRSVWNFDAAGHLVGVEDAYGRALTLAYAGGKLMAVTDDDSGRSLSFTYVGDRVETVATTAVAGPSYNGPLVWRYVYDGDLLTRVCDARDPDPVAGRCTAYGYTDNRLTTVTLPRGNVSQTLSYNADGKVAWSENGESERVTFTYGGGLTQVEDGRGNTTSYFYDPLYRTTSIVDPLFHTTTYWYSAEGFRSRVDDANGNMALLYYDARGNLLAEVNGEGETTWSTYDANDNLTQRRDGRSSSQTDNTYLTSFTYNAQGDKLTETSPTTVEFPSGVTQTWTYTAGGEDHGWGPVPAGLLHTTNPGVGGDTIYFYDSQGDLRRRVDPSGLVTEFEHDALGRVTSTTVTWEDGTASTVRSYDQLGNVLTETGPVTSDQTVTPAVPHQRRTTNVYDANGNLESSTISDVGGGAAATPSRTTSYVRDDADRVVQTTDPENGVSTVVFDAAGNPTRVTDAEGRVLVTTYDAANRRTRLTLEGFVDDPTGGGSDPRDAVLQRWEYDNAGRLVRELTPAPGTGGLPGQLSPASTPMVARVHTYDRADRRISTTLAGFHNRPGVTPATRDIVLEQLTYDDAGNVIASVTGGGKASTTNVYDAANRLQSTTLELGAVDRVTEFDYDAAGNPLRQTVSEGASAVEHRFGYDTARRRTTVTVENGATDLVTTSHFDRRGLVVGVTDPRGNRTDSTFDADGQLIETRAPAVTVEEPGQAPTSARPTTRYGYDAAGNRTGVIDPRGNTTTSSYDRLNRLVRVDHPAYTPPDGGPTVQPFETWTYDRVGNQISTRDRRGRVTDYTFDARNRVVRRLDPLVTGHSARGETGFRYDDAGNQVQTTDPTGAVVRAGFDDLGRQRTATAVVRQATPPALEYTTTFDYDDLGNRTLVEDPTGVTTTTVFDAASRATTVIDDLGKATTYTYGADGRVLRSVDPLGRVVDHGFDPAGREIETTKRAIAGGPALATTYQGYDPAGNLTEQRSARSTSATDTTYLTTVTFDAVGRITQIVEPDGATPITTTYGYDAAGNLTRFTDGEGRTTTYTYNPWDLRETTTEPATTLHPSVAERRWATTYDAGGLPVHEQQPGGVDVTRTFDELGRLLSEAGTGGGATAASRSFGYDLAGRRTTIGHPDGAVTLGYDDRGLLTTASVPGGAGTAAMFAYDPAGRMTTRTDAAGETTYTWTPRGELDTVDDPLTGTVTNYDWNDAGQAAQVTYGTATTRTYVYDDLGRLDTDTLTGTAGTLWSVDYGYDPDGNLTSQNVTAPGNPAAGTHTYGYDPSGRIATWTPPTGPTVDYSYDNAGNRLTAGTSTFTYDQRNRLLTEDSPEGDTTYTWTARGTLSSTSHVPAALDVALVVANPASLSAADTATRNRLTGSGHTVTTVDDGAPAATGYDLVVVAGSAAEATVGSKYRSSTTGVLNMKPQLWDNDALSTGTASSATRTSDYVVGAGHPAVAGRTGTVTVTANQNHYSVADSALGTGAIQLLDRAAATTSNVEFAYNAGANLAGSAGPAPARRVALGWSPAAVDTLTADGWAIFDATATWAGSAPVVTNTQFDALGRMVAEGDATYAYDALDRVITRDEDGAGATAATSFEYAGVEIDPVKWDDETYARTPGGELAALNTGTGGRVAVENRHGDLAALLDPAGTVTDTTVYDPYGDTAGSTGTSDPALGYQGDWTDPASGQVWMGARWYQPGTATFTSRDTVFGVLSTPITLNRYTYAAGDPLEYFDPDGQFSIGGALRRVGRAVSGTVSTVRRGVDRVVRSTVSTINRRVVRPIARVTTATVSAVRSTISTTVRAVAGAGRRVARAANTVATTVQRAARAAPAIAREALQDATEFVERNAGTIASVGAGVLTYAGCSAATGGVGATNACLVAAGAVAGAVDGAFQHCGRGHSATECAAGVIGGGAIGAGSSFIGAGIGGAVMRAGGGVVSRVTAAAAGGFAESATGSAATQLVTTGEINAADVLRSGFIGAGTAGATAAIAPAVDAPNCRVNSFLPATLVLMADGTTKPIADIEVGDLVLAADPETGERGPRRVTDTIVGDGVKDLVDINIDGHVVTATAGHPFWVDDQGDWIDARDLEAGDDLLLASGGDVEIDTIRHRTEIRRVHNLTVDGIHTYYVLAGNDPVLVHNCGTGPTADAASPQAVRAPSTSGTPRAGLGVNDPPARVSGPWTDADLQRGLLGRPPRSLGSPELHHADQMPGSGVHEVFPGPHRAPGVHPNPRHNQGVTHDMRTADRQLHWWYRAQEMGAWERLGPEAIYNNWPEAGQ